MRRFLKIVHLTAELSPYSRTGGLADVCRSLPRALYRLGHKIAVITPFYGCIEAKKWLIEDLKEKIVVKLAGQSFEFSFKKTIAPDKYPVFFVCQKQLFGSRRKSQIYEYTDNGLCYLLFDLAALELIKILKFKPDVLHCHDWHGGLIPQYLKTKYKNDPHFKNTTTLFTIHNLLFQGPLDWWKIPPEKIDSGKDLPPLASLAFGGPPEDLGKVPYLNFVKRGIIYADVINTVSERYAQEILTPEFGCLLDKYLLNRKNDVYGIINGVDYKVFNPKFDKDIHVNYDAESLEKKIKNKVALQKEFNLEINPKIPLLGLANRLTEQKGFELIIQILDNLLKLDLQVAIVGSGAEGYAKFLKEKARKNPQKLLFITPFRENAARKIYAASDLYLMPSRFEPCGISQLISLRYGSIPIVHETGGLSETISDYNYETGRGNGFTFSSYSAQELLMTIIRAIKYYEQRDNWQKLVKRAMRESYSWRLPAKKYVLLYRKAIKKKTINK